MSSVDMFVCRSTTGLMLYILSYEDERAHVTAAIVFPPGTFLGFYTPQHNSGGVLLFHVSRPCVRPSVVCPSVFSFPDDLSKYQMIFAKLGMCIDIVEI